MIFRGDFVGSYLVVGGSSDIGLILCERLIEEGNSVTVIGRDSSRMSQIKDLGAEFSSETLQMSYSFLK